MSRNNNYQQLQEFVSSLRSQQKDIVCRDCGGISTTKIQELLSRFDDTKQLLSNKKKNVRKNSSKQRKKKKIIRKQISNSTKQRKLNIKKIRSSRK